MRLSAFLRPLKAIKNDMRTFRTIQGCPVFADIAPYIAVCINDARVPVNSIYRGQDAAAILHRHGHETQAEAYDKFIHHRGAPANRPGQSTHELRSDGVAYRGYRVGAPLPWWCQGFDVNDRDVQRVKAAANRYGWKLFQPYHSGTDEFHHLNFAERPKRPLPGSRLWVRLVRLRASLPRN